MPDDHEDIILAAGRFLTLRRRRRWEFVERPHVKEVVVLIAVTAEQQAVLVEQYREPVQARMIEWAAGLVGDEEGDDDEHMLDAANRELEEETGYRARNLEVIGHGPSSGGLTSEIVTFIEASGLEKVGPGGGVGNEAIRVHLVPLGGVDTWLDERVGEGCLIDPKVYAGLYFLSRKAAGK